MLGWLWPLVIGPLGLGGNQVTVFVSAAGISTSFGQSPTISRKVQFNSAGESVSDGTSVLLAARGLNAKGQSASLSSHSALSRTTLIVGYGQSASFVGASVLIVQNQTLKISPRAATIVDVGLFTGSGSIVRRTA